MFGILAVVAGCPDGSSDNDDDFGDGRPGSNSSSSTSSSGSPDASSGGEAAKKPLTPIEKIQETLATCTKPSTGLYQTDEDSAAGDIPICERDGLDVVWWRADLDIDCDGEPSDICNVDTDPAFQPDTAARSSTNEPLDATLVPYVVIPSVSERYDFTKAGLEMGSVVLIIHGDKIAYGILGDTGPDQIIGEASYKMAQLLGIDPDPATGGSSATNILFVAFKGKESVVKKAEDPAEAEALAKKRQAALFPVP
jgi:hypothetical protein